MLKGKRAKGEDEHRERVGGVGGWAYRRVDKGVKRKRERGA